MFRFFAEPENLERITPPMLRFRILTPLPIAMRAGAVIEYRLRVYGIAQYWRTLIEAWEPPYRFVDVQERGPYASWHHEHVFEPAPDGTRVIDRVAYRLPFGPLGRLAHALFVRRSLRHIFDYRSRILSEIYNGPVGAFEHNHQQGESR